MLQRWAQLVLLIDHLLTAWEERIMSGLVWVSGAMMDERLKLNVKSDIVVNDVDRAVAGIRRMTVGERLSEDCFPRQIWPGKGAKGRVTYPDFFDSNGYWIVSDKVAGVFQKFDIGNASLYPVEILQKDRRTLVGATYHSLNICNQKQVFIATESPDTRPFLSEEERTLKFVHKDYDVAVSNAALDGVDIWIDPKLHRAFFVSDPLARALKAGGVARYFGLRRCRVL